MFTREELFEYFSGQYSQEQVINALNELAKADSSINPGALEFPAAITEKLEGTFQVIEGALDKHKLLIVNAALISRQLKI